MTSIKSFIFFSRSTLLLFSSMYTAFAMEYNRIIIFKEPIPDKVLPDHVIRRETVPNEGSCRVKCYMEPNCVSINVGPADDGTNTCELNNATDESPSQSSLKEKKHYIHFAIENFCQIYHDPCPGEDKLCQVGFTDKHYRCICREGFKLEGDECKDINECDEDLHNCTFGMKCVNEPGSFRCDCLPGFTKDKAICKDIDECMSAMLHNCSPNMTCVNEPGSFHCECITGKCKVTECDDALGMESGAISDAQISASSQWPNSLAAIHGRLHFKKDPGKKGGSWSAKHNNLSQWLQVDLGNHLTKVTGLATQGRNGQNQQWVTKYKVQYGHDVINFQYFKDEFSGIKAKEFVGNTDRDTVVYHKLNNSIRARYIRFRPTAWHRHISMRVEIYGCKDCQDALGMENGRIIDRQISASSESAFSKANQSRLRFKSDSQGRGGAWSAGTMASDYNQWLQIDLSSQYATITAVATQGRSDQDEWVTEYKLQYSDSSLTFQYYREPGKSTDKIFAGNVDRDAVVPHSLSAPFTSQYIRFQPISWHGHISMRVELYGCKENWEKINHGPVCYEAKGGEKSSSRGVFTISTQGMIHTFKLVHRRGALKCASSLPATFWGCLYDGYGDRTLATVITYKNKTVLPLAEYREVASGCLPYLYKIEGIGVNSTELVFNNLPSPISVTKGQKFKIWYSEVLSDCGDVDNSGEICVDVYGWYA